VTGSRYRIVARGAAERYRGMDRPPLGSLADVPELLMLRGLALEDVPPERAENEFVAFIAELRHIGAKNYDLLAVGDIESDGWVFLGYDVGEETPRAWSAIANASCFLDPDELGQWTALLNRNGLFDDRGDAERYLARYLASGDPDSGWTADGWSDTPDLYAVIPVFLFVAAAE
jgi:hypothetical protein